MFLLLFIISPTRHLGFFLGGFFFFSGRCDFRDVSAEKVLRVAKRNREKV